MPTVVSRNISSSIFLGLILPLSALGLDIDVRSVGAVGDGRTDDTAALRLALDRAAKDGGVVRLPSGIYVSGTLQLRSNVSLVLEAGAVLQASEEAAVFALPEENKSGDEHQYQDFGHRHWQNSLIWAEGAENISILGPGRIYGKGLSRGVDNDNAVRPHANKAIALKNCRNVLLADFSILHGGWFGLLATGVDNLVIRGLAIDTNRDGIDIDACRNVRVADCTINSPLDDAICLKSSYALDALCATENVTITNCQVSGYDEGTLLDGTFQRTWQLMDGPTGRIKMGTESNGGFKNITISNCVFAYSRGLALEVVDGGTIEDVVITGLTMRDIVNAPIFIIQGARLRGPAGTAVGAIRRVQISHVVASNVSATAGILILGRPEKPIEDISLSHLTIEYQGGGTAPQALHAVADRPKGYPEPSFYGTLPSYGLFARDVGLLQADHLRFGTRAPDARPAVALHGVDSAIFESCTFAGVAPAGPFALSGVKRFETYRVSGVPDGLRAP